MKTQKQMKATLEAGNAISLVSTLWADQRHTLDANKFAFSSRRDENKRGYGKRFLQFAMIS
jgi:DNA helicase TIP49 (TBP-interacting protein)